MVDSGKDNVAELKVDMRALKRLALQKFGLERFNDDDADDDENENEDDDDEDDDDDDDEEGDDDDEEESDEDYEEGKKWPE